MHPTRDKEFVLHWWRNGNGECDCNRRMHFEWANDPAAESEHDLDCGSSAFAVPWIEIDGERFDVDSESERRSETNGFNSIKS